MTKCKTKNLSKHLLQERVLLCRELFMISSTKRRHAENVTLTLLLHLLKSLQKLLSLVRCNFSSSTELSLKIHKFQLNWKTDLYRTYLQLQFLFGLNLANECLNGTRIHCLGMNSKSFQHTGKQYNKKGNEHL